MKRTENTWLFRQPRLRRPNDSGPQNTENWLNLYHCYTFLYRDDAEYLGGVQADHEASDPGGLCDGERDQGDDVILWP
ncbi:hypothetical protein N7447_009558 [Penicillium robsamsonii]|uniref:uncharacterized protein n=1 Tax=Penicillium robsamsonii TaxID=1792511 RepID=UPI0025479C4B|nr:uncharacterized protein N7447_009558 [Penicillium robsamsonii]KAJ5817325.1 hypothetical protein N7447_009558 [Penicillium robsamsonii]